MIDYKHSNFTDAPDSYDVIFDAVGKSNFECCKPLLKPKGRYLSTVLSARIVWEMLLTKLLGGKRAMFIAAGLMQSKANLNFLLQLIQEKHLRPTIDLIFPLQELRAAHLYVGAGHKQGNVVIQISKELV